MQREGQNAPNEPEKIKNSSRGVVFESQRRAARARPRFQRARKVAKTVAQVASYSRRRRASQGPRGSVLLRAMLLA